MATPPRAIKEFLARKRRDSSKPKKASARTVDRKLAALEPQPTFVTSPYLHQKVCFLLGVYFERYAFFLDMGLGKTKLASDLFSYFSSCYRNQRREHLRGLVLVPNTANIEGWRDEVAKHAPDLTFEGLDISGKSKRLAAVAAGSDMLVTTYAGWAALVCRRGKKGLEVDPEKQELEGRFDFVVFDESSFLRNHNTLAFRLAKRLANSARHVFLLTGTPLGKNPQDLWTQLYLVDGGHTLGATLGLFRAAFFRESQNYWGGREYEFRKRMTVKLSRCTRHASIRYTDEECLDLPDTVGGLLTGSFDKRYTLYTPEQLEAADALNKAIREARGERDIVESKYVALRRLESGYAKLEDGTLVPFRTNPKLDLLASVLDDIPREESVIIVHHYRQSGDLIAQLLESRKDKFVRLVGAMTPVKTRASVTKFRSGAARVLVCSKSGSYGHNFQISRRIIFFESFDDPITRKQMEKRIRRPGQKRRTYITDLVVRGGIGDRILYSLLDGKKIFDELMEDSKRGRSC